MFLIVSKMKLLGSAKLQWLTARKSKLGLSNALYTSFDFSDKNKPICQSSHHYKLTVSLTTQDCAFVVKCYE